MGAGGRRGFEKRPIGCDAEIAEFLSEYVSFDSKQAPKCGDFTAKIETKLFTMAEFGQHNKEGAKAPYKYVLIQATLLKGIEEVNSSLMNSYPQLFDGRIWEQPSDAFHAAIFAVQAGYRKPSYSKKYFDTWASRHVFGDAIDVDLLFNIKTQALRQTRPLAYLKAREAGYIACACVEPWKLTKTHVHYDWRAHRNPSACPKPVNPNDPNNPDEDSLWYRPSGGKQCSNSAPSR